MLNNSLQKNSHYVYLFHRSFFANQNSCHILQPGHFSIAHIFVSRSHNEPSIRKDQFLLFSIF